MKTTLLLLLSAAVLLSGCRGERDPTGPGVTDVLLIYGNAARESLHRAVTPHFHAPPGTRLDAFEQTIAMAEHDTAVNCESPQTATGPWKFRYDGKHAIYYGRFIREEAPPNENSPAFSPDEITDPAALAARLRAGSDPLSAWLFSRFSESGRKAISNEPTASVLAHELTAVVYGPPIYDETRFRGVTLRPQTSRLLQLHPRFQPSPDALNLYHHGLNRALLEDAWPQELAKKQRVPWTHHYVAVKN